MPWTQLGPAGEPVPPTSTADDMAVMRARWAEAHGRSPDLPSDVAVLWAEVGRLRADLAECRRRLETIYDLVEARLNLAALSAGGGGHDEGNDDEVNAALATHLRPGTRVRIKQGEGQICGKHTRNLTEVISYTVRLDGLTIGNPYVEVAPDEIAAVSGRAADTEGRQG